MFEDFLGLYCSFIEMRSAFMWSRVVGWMFFTIFMVFVTNNKMFLGSKVFVTIKIPELVYSDYFSQLLFLSKQF